MNLHYLLYTKYFDDFKNPGNITKSNNSLFGTFKASNSEIPFTQQSFVMKTTYPGLLVGVGYPHEMSVMEDNESAIKLGFSLDYVTGLPFIPGSSVKGMLRSCFKRYPEYIIGLLDGSNKDVINMLEENIFDGNQDVFLDALPVKTDAKNRLLGDDYITSHKAKNPAYDGLTDPNPVKIMKLMPGVRILFRFLLNESKVNDGNDEWILSGGTKLELFRLLLGTFGIGAKTNTGYGRLESATGNGNYCYLQNNR